MNPPDTRTLTTLLDRETAARDTLVLALQQAEQQLAQALAQAAALDSYRAETVARWSAQTKVSATVDDLHGYRHFLERLDQALEQQAGVVRRAESGVAKKRAERIAAETRVAAIGKLIGRREQQHLRTLERRDQRTTDEAAQRLVWSANANSRMGPLN